MVAFCVDVADTCCDVCYCGLLIGCDCFNWGGCIYVFVVWDCCWVCGCLFLIVVI